MGAHTEIPVRFVLTGEQMARLDALTERLNQSAPEGQWQSPADVFAGLLVLGSSHLIDDRLDWLERALNAPLRR